MSVALEDNETERLVERAEKLPELLGDFDELLRALARNSNISYQDLWDAAKEAAREDLEVEAGEREYQSEVRGMR